MTQVYAFYRSAATPAQKTFIDKLATSPMSDLAPVVLAYSTIPPVTTDKQKTHRGYHWRWVALELMNEC